MRAISDGEALALWLILLAVLGALALGVSQ